MITAIREWLISIVAMAMLLAVAESLLPENSIRKTASFAGGLVGVIVLLQPLLDVDLDCFHLELDAYEQAVQTRQEELTHQEEKELAELIAQQTGAYISDKADALGLSVTVQVHTKLQEEQHMMVPDSVEITGPRSDALSSYIEEELGIPQERQVWHEGNN